MSEQAGQEKGAFKYRKCAACKGTGYDAKEMNNPIFAGVCRACQGMRVVGGKKELKHVPQYQSTWGPRT